MNNTNIFNTTNEVLWIGYTEGYGDESLEQFVGKGRVKRIVASQVETAQLTDEELDELIAPYTSLIYLTELDLDIPFPIKVTHYIREIKLSTLRYVLCNKGYTYLEERIFS